jgi:cell division protein FtsI (penicillin-binding protein 3)
MYPNAKPINWVAFRIVFIALLFAAGTVVLLARAYRLHVSDADVLKKRAEKQRTKVLHLEARRGMIMDRSGEQVAASLEVHSIYARPRRISQKKQTAKQLAELLDIDEPTLMAKLQEDKTFVWIQRRVSPLVSEKVKEADLDGVFTVTEYQRFYPLKDLAAHAVGFAGLDSRGLEGLELSYDTDLRTEPIPVTAQKDALGRPVMFAALGQDPKRHDLHLTLDRNIQYAVEREMQSAVVKVGAKSGTAVVLDPDTGEILALAIRPAYNLNVFQKTAAAVRRNRGVADAFEPGSTFKVFTAAAALDLDRVMAGERFDCHNGIFRYNGADIHDVTPHGKLSFDEVLIHSSNIGAVKIADKLTKGEFYRVVTSFGFGALTGVDLPGERPGALTPPGRWSALTKANISFGQGISVNAIQLTSAFAASINGGFLYKPHLMKRITNALGETIKENQPVLVRRVIKQSTSERLVSILRKAIEEGTGKAAAIPGADVVGKTGTAQKADPSGGYSEDRYVASFIGAIMDAQPRLVILVVLDEPAVKKRTGGKIAAPVFNGIGRAILALRGGKPAESEAIVASAPDEGIKTSAATLDGLSIRRGPARGEWIVPDLKGLDMRQVVEVCGRIKCDPSFQGWGHAVNQDPKPGSLLKEGATITVSFAGQAS